MLTKIMIRKSLLILACSTALAGASDNFRYYVFDDTKTANVSYTVENDLSGFIDDSDNTIQVSIDSSYGIGGCALKSFTYREEPDAWHYVSHADYERVLAFARGIDLHKLVSSPSTMCSLGWLEFDGVQHNFNNPLDDPTRKKFHTALLALVDQIVPRHERKFVTTTIEGDFEPARTVTVAELLKHPARYNGKRVRITGYYHSEFEDSSLYDKKGDPMFHALWVDGASSFAREKDLQWTDDGHVIMEGCFIQGPDGHLGGWPGELQRVTRVVSLDPPLPPPLPADQSSKR
jgi:hypothetical protein